MRIQIRDLVNPGYGIRDMKKTDPGSWINIPDPQHCVQVRYALRQYRLTCFRLRTRLSQIWLFLSSIRLDLPTTNPAFPIVSGQDQDRVPESHFQTKPSKIGEYSKSVGDGLCRYTAAEQQEEFHNFSWKVRTTKNSQNTLAWAEHQGWI
jgi:hypothetical protein